MKKLIVGLSVVLMTGCAGTRFTMGVGHEINGVRAGHQPTGILQLDVPLYKDTSCGILHTSNVFDGKPFNDNVETKSDVVYCAYTYTFKD